MNKFFATLFLSFCLLTFSQAQIVITEIMYNPPESGTDSLEFVEFYNNSDVMVDVTGYTFTGFIDTLPNMQMMAGEYLVMAVNADAMMNNFGVTARQWMSGGMSNGGELVEIKDAAGNVIDAVQYDDNDPWATEPDGDGNSLELCDVNADNSLGENWNASPNGTGIMINGAEVFASPGAANTAECAGPPADHVVAVGNFSFDPADLTIMVGETVEWQNNDGFHNVNGSLDTYPDNPEGFSSGAAASAPWTFSHTFNTPGVYDYQCDPHVDMGMVGTVTVLAPPMSDYTPYPVGQVSTVDADGLPDSLGVLVELEGVVYGVNLLSGSLSFTLIDDVNDGINVFNFGNDYGYSVTEGDRITVQGAIGEFNGLLEVLADTVIFISAGNTLFDPTVVTTLDESTESQLVRMNAMTLVDPDQWSGDGSSFNVDITDGTNTFIMRIDNETDLSTEPAPLVVFDVIGIGGQFDNSAPHDSGYQLFPRYIPDIMPVITDVITLFDDEVSTDINTDVEIDVLMNDIIQNPVTVFGLVNSPSDGMLTVDFTDTTIVYSPDLDFCGEDGFDYFICDAMNCDTATVTIDVICPTIYPEYDIATITSLDAEGVPDSLDVICQVRGIVYGVNLRSGGLQFTVIDSDDADAGISVFSFDEDFGYTVQEGDEVIVRGSVDQFNGLTQMAIEEVELLTSDNALHSAEVVSTQEESHESKLVTYEGVSFVDPGQWTGSGSGFNVDITDGTNTFVIRIDNDVDLYSMPIPAGALFNITGIGGQFDNESPYDSGYQLLPRYAADIVAVPSTTNDLSLAQDIRFYPNPVNDQLQIELATEIESIEMTNLMGQVIKSIHKPAQSEQLDVTGFTSGMYIISFRTADRIWSATFVKQ